MCLLHWVLLWARIYDTYSEEIETFLRESKEEINTVSRIKLARFAAAPPLPGGVAVDVAAHDGIHRVPAVTVVVNFMKT